MAAELVYPADHRDLQRSSGSYPGLTQTKDGVIVAVWQAQRDDGGRDIRYARFTREWLLSGDVK